jgi:hypothetical protein
MTEEFDMEEMHRNHKDVPFGWLALLADLIQRAPARSRKQAARTGRYLVAPWIGRSPTGWSA